MNADTKKLGKWGEGIAAEYLERSGYSIVTRNYHTPVGEIDIVAVNQDQGSSYLVFVEVKTRTSQEHGYPEEAFTRSKWDHLRASIQYYFESHPEVDLEWSVDLIAILGHPACGNPQIMHFDNIVKFDER